MRSAGRSILFAPYVVWLVAIAACALESNRDPPEVGVAYNGISCNNGMFNLMELCVTNPGATVIATGEQVVTVLAVDVTGEGVRDVVAASANGIWIRRGLPFGFGGQVSLGSPGAIFTDVAAGDFDGDGDLDLAATDMGTNRVIVWRNNGLLAFSLWQQINVAALPIRILAGRLDGDAKDDLALLSFGTHEVSVLLANGFPFTFPVAYMVGDAEDFALGDCNGDNWPDLLYANGMGAAAQLRARTGNAFAAYGAPIVSVLPLFAMGVGPLDAFAITAGPFDAVAGDDVVVSASFARLAPMVSNGFCGFAPTFTPMTMPTTWAWTRARLRNVAWTLDARLDVVAPHGDPASPGDQVYSIVPGTGAGTFNPYLYEPHTPGTVVPKDLAFTDADGDTRLDVLVAADTGVILERRIP